MKKAYNINWLTYIYIKHISKLNQNLYIAYKYIRIKGLFNVLTLIYGVCPMLIQTKIQLPLLKSNLLNRTHLTDRFTKGTDKNSHLILFARFSDLFFISMYALKMYPGIL